MTGVIESLTAVNDSRRRTEVYRMQAEPITSSVTNCPFDMVLSFWYRQNSIRPRPISRNSQYLDV